MAGKPLTPEEIKQLLENAPRRGRPLQRDLWADQIWDELWKVHPDGLAPKDLRTQAGLSHSQLHAGVYYLRDTFDEERDVPVVYVRNENKWYIAPSWTQHTRQAIRSEYLQQSAKRLDSAVSYLQKSERAFPSKARRIKKVQRNVIYCQEEINDLIAELPA